MGLLDALEELLVEIEDDLKKVLGEHAGTAIAGALRKLAAGPRRAAEQSAAPDAPPPTVG